MVNKKRNKVRFVAGCTGFALYIMTCMPVDTEYGMAFDWSKFGAGGLFSAIFIGLFVAIVMNFFSKKSFFKEDSPMPSFVAGWIDSILPILLCMLLGYWVIIVNGIDVQSVISVLLKPVMNIAQSYPGYLILSFLPIAFYSMGISDWVFTPIHSPVANWAIAENAALVAAGQKAQYINCQGVAYHEMMGGTGCTWPLVVYCSLSKSQRFKTIGRISIVPAIFNINEPLIFGVVAFNPLLMIPMWLVGLILPTITYFALHLGLATIPSAVFNMWYAPAFLNVYMLSGDVRNVILAIVNFVVAALIYYPFFKAAEKQEIEREKAALEAKESV